MHLALCQRGSPAPLRRAETLNIYLVASARYCNHKVKPVPLLMFAVTVGSIKKINDTVGHGWRRKKNTTFRLGFACGFVRLDVGLQLGCNGAVLMRLYLGLSQ